MNIKPALSLITAAALASLVGSVAATSAVAADSEKKSSGLLHGNDCVFFRTVHDFQSLDDTNLVVWAPSKRDAYHVQLTMPLFDLKFASQLAFIDKNNDGQLCSYGMDALAVADSSIPQRSTIGAIKRLDAEGIAQLETQYKTKLTRESKKKKPQEPERTTAQ